MVDECSLLPVRRHLLTSYYHHLCPSSAETHMTLAGLTSLIRTVFQT